MTASTATVQNRGVSISSALQGKHVLVTGVTGFVGEALLHLLLTEVPGVRVSVVVRPKGKTTGHARTAALLGKPIFADAVTAAGGVEELMAARVGVVDGDLTAVPELPTGLDAVVHCAGDVSFDPPVDAGFRTNVVGTRALLERVREAGPDVHYVHISTAYVAGRRRGAIPEGPVDHDVDLDAELAWGLAQRQSVEHRSRLSGILEKHRRKAERRHSPAGPITTARAIEHARQEWVKKELVRLGTERARSLGWTDCYTFTKALGERVVEAYAAGSGQAGEARRVSIVRPSIIESALARPYPGWIEGFKMAEPLILAYGRGELPEFPASGDTIVDIVPVDQVVAAIVAVLANPPEPGGPAYFHVSSGDRNPLVISELYKLIRGYFEKHPFAAGDRGATRLPDWRFPGAQVVERLLTTSEKAHFAADYLLGRVPRGNRTRDLARKLDVQGRRLEFLRRYLDIYREYASAQLRFRDERTLALYESLSPEDREIFAFDTSCFEWSVYLPDIHCAAVTEPIRQLDERRAARRRTDPAALKPLTPVAKSGLDTSLVPRDGSTTEEGSTTEGSSMVEVGEERARLETTEGSSMVEEGEERARLETTESSSMVEEGEERARLETTEDEPQVAAFFDLDGTLLSSNVIESFLWLRLPELTTGDRVTQLGKVATRAPAWVQAERRDRTDFLRSVYRQYAGARLADLDALADEHLTTHVLSRLSPAAARRIRAHRAAGHRTVLITGAVRPLTRPLAPLFDHIEAADLAADDRGICTGFLASTPLVGEARAAWMRSYAADQGIDLAKSYGYADSHSDLPLLEAVGNPVAVRPDVPLYRHARKARWNIVDWASPPTASRLDLGLRGGR